MPAGHDVEHLLLGGDTRHRVGNGGVHVAEDHVDVVAVDQLAGFLHPGADVVGAVLDQQFDLTAEDAVLFVDFLDGVFGALYFPLRQSGQDPGQRIDHADLDRGVAARADDEG